MNVHVSPARERLLEAAAALIIDRHFAGRYRSQGGAEFRSGEILFW
jgi:hypothetical protein